MSGLPTNGNGNGHGRSLMAYWQPIALIGAFLVQWGIQSNRIDGLNDDVVDLEAGLRNAVVEIGTVRGMVADNTTLYKFSNDRLNAQRERIDRHDTEIGALNQNLTATAQATALLAERIATLTERDSPRLRAIEDKVATMLGRVEEMGRSLEAIRAYVAQGRAGNGRE